MTPEEIIARFKQLNEEMMADLAAWRAGRLSDVEVVERGLRRQFERRWLEMKAYLTGVTLSGFTLPAVEIIHDN